MENNKTDKAEVSTAYVIRNSFVLFFRMFVLMLVNLYSVRIVLHNLGKEEYGVYSAVAGIVLLLSSVSTVLAMAVQRFMSLAIGRGDSEEEKRIYSAGINLCLLFSFIAFVVFETLGVWFLNNKVEYSQYMANDVAFVFQFSIFSFIFTIMQIPFLAAVISHEDMNLFSAVTIFECFARLGVAFFIGYVSGHEMIVYGLGLMMISAIVFALYVLCCKLRYSSCRYTRAVSPELYREVAAFSIWILFGTTAGVAMQQGNMLLMNSFFGPLVNAAFALALQMTVAYNSFGNCILMALRPAMTKLYAQHKNSQLNRMFAIGNKFLFYALLFISVPIFIEMPVVLSIWLGDVDENMVLFSRLIIIYMVILLMNNPITIIVQAIGRVREYVIKVETLMICAVPITCLCYKFGNAAVSAIYVMITICVIAHIMRLVCLRRFYQYFSVTEYIKNFVMPAIFVSAVFCIMQYALHNSVSNVIYRIFITLFVIMPINASLICFIVINDKEKNMIKGIVNRFVKV